MRKDYGGSPFTLYIIPRLKFEERSLPSRDNDCKRVGENIAFFMSRFLNVQRWKQKMSGH